MNTKFMFCSGCSSSISFLETVATGDYLSNAVQSGNFLDHLNTGRRDRNGNLKAINTIHLKTGAEDYQLFCRSLSKPHCVVSGAHDYITLFGKHTEPVGMIYTGGQADCPTNLSRMLCANDLSYAHAHGITKQHLPTGFCYKCGTPIN